MRKRVFVFIAAAVIAAGPLFASGQQGASGAASGKPYEPSRNIEWVCTSGPGGGSDIFTRMITDIAGKEGISRANFLVVNKSDGGGEVGRAQVSQAAGPLADHTLITFNSGDLMPMLQNTSRRVKDFKIIAVMALDKQLLYVGKTSKYQSFQQVIDAIKAGKTVVVGGSKGDDVATFNLMLKECGWTEAQMPYITHNSSNEAITAILGDHIDIVVSKPAASAPYVEAGQLKPILALSNERYTGNLAAAPLLGEFKPYKNVEFPTWRGVAAPAAMSGEAQAYWSTVMEKVSKTDAWRTGYLDKFKLVGAFMPSQEATAYETKFEKDFMAAQGIK
ncbi:MAG: tripartite tricarboxylate transporter substrate binding protein [Spirochaetales bacterium]|jgi:putative tricarboxylic transport membrane protein|nr:tripartite tricarboxylate transporter substrate binding protein [Spirochaetales bacterium]